MDVITAIERADGDAVVAALRGLSEPERRALAPELQRLARELNEGVAEWRQRPVAQAAVAGTATFTELRRMGGWWAAQIDPEAGVAVLLDRRPSWLASYAEWLLRAEAAFPPWSLVRGLVRAGAIERPPAPLYLTALIRAGREGRAAELLADDPALLEHELWALLTADTGEDSLRAADVENEWVKGAGWSALIQACEADGRMPRERVLDAVLDGLANDLVAYRVPWHTKLWKDLAPTREELALRADRLRVLLGAPAEPIVAFAVEQLGRARVTVPAGDLTPALVASSKKTVRGALKLLGEQPGPATVALGHPDAAIQGEVLDRLERWGVDDAARDGLLRHLDLLAATVRPRAEALLGVALPTVEAAIEVDVSDIPEAIRVALNFGGPLPPAPIAGEPVLAEPSTTEDGPAISRPTHAGGWIEPRTLVERVRDAEQPSENAFAQALLRLAPEGRAEALAAAGDLPGRAGALLRCALGGEPVDGDDPAAIAALAVAGLTPITIEVTHALDDVRPIDQLVVTFAGPRNDGPLGGLLATLSADDSLRWHRTPDPCGFPARRDIAAAGGINRIGWSLGTDYTMLTGALDLFPLLLRPTEPIAPLTARFIVLALGSIDDREHLLAADLLIAAIEDGRLDALPADDIVLIKPNRLAARLVTIAEAGPLPRAVVRDFLDTAVERFPPRSGPLLVLFDELCAQTDTGPLVAREHLRTLNHKAAKALLKREHTPSETEAQLALAARVRRAQRWSKR